MPTIASETEMFFNDFPPKMKHQFQLFIDGIPAYVIKKLTMPNYVQESRPIDYINLRRFVKGKLVWQPIQITTYDPIVPSAAQALIEWTRLHHESVTGRDGYPEMYKKDLVLSELGPVGDRIGEWILKGAFITESNFGDLDWATDEPQEITFTIQMDFCIKNF
jgi:hypothetical protein